MRASSPAACTTAKVLVIDGSRRNPNPWASLVRKAGYEVSATVPREEAVPGPAGELPDLAVVGPSSAASQLECIQQLKAAAPGLPILVLSEEPDLFATDRCGPFEAVVCISPEAAFPDLAGGLALALEPSPYSNGGPPYPAIIGRSREILQIRQKIKAVADKDISVLITGESGTGKELIARAVHCHSKRFTGPLVKISCGALPDDLLESEVFGYQRGAFTGAYANKPGRLELAQGGTLFLDEVGDLSLFLQVKFLQVLEEKTVSRLGGTEERFVDARVVAATNADLAERVQQGAFRNDLFYRLSVIHIHAPPLRNRPEDVPLLIHYFLHKYCRETGRQVLDLPEAVSRRLLAYSWPGNVRELENLVRSAMAMRGWSFLDQALEEALCVDEDEKPPESRTDGEAFPPLPDDRICNFFAQEGGSLKSLVRTCTSELERDAIRKVLDRVRWNRKKAAELLGVSYKTLLNRIADLDLEEG
ncbi:MAG: sigma-54 dependent transcriptional regulator [Deltaproteobacteria bacterium]|nr:sigma-54 dependent transcriptional regulator [Deltaproteobacteria bacterium]